MNTLFSLDGRLSVCAGLVRHGAKVADVGTDHAYLPVWLAKNGRIASAVASDIRPKPLAAGQENIDRYGCGDIVKTRLCGGLDKVLPEEADDIVIAGMGGELMAQIIDAASWLRDPAKRLILQPMTKAHSLREYLCRGGFGIISETPCTHAGKYYTVIHAEFTGRGGAREPFYYYTGELMNDCDEAREYVRSVLRKLYKKRGGTAAAGGDTAQLDGIIADILERFPESEVTL